MLTVCQATTPADLRAVKALVRELMIREYHIPPDHVRVTSITLPGEYAPPDGAILLARDDDEPIGCVLLRRLDAAACEMKRLYVRPKFRGQGCGKSLAQEAIALAQRIGYRQLKLFTVGELQAAVALYRRLGLVECEPFTDDLPPVDDVIFMELPLMP